MPCCWCVLTGVRNKTRRGIVLLLILCYSTMIDKEFIQPSQKTVSEERDDFQAIIVEVIYGVIIPDPKVLQELEFNPGSDSENFKAILEMSYRHLRKNRTWLQEPSTKQTFCWGIVTSCCSRITIVHEHFQWLKYRFIVMQLCKIFTVCLDHNEISKDRSTTIQRLPSENMKLVSYLYACVSFMHLLYIPNKDTHIPALCLSKPATYCKVYTMLTKIVSD